MKKPAAFTSQGRIGVVVSQLLLDSGHMLAVREVGGDAIGLAFLP
jgi:hypothetical protein